MFEWKVVGHDVLYRFEHGAPWYALNWAFGLWLAIAVPLFLFCVAKLTESPKRRGFVEPPEPIPPVPTPRAEPGTKCELCGDAFRSLFFWKSWSWVNDYDDKYNLCVNHAQLLRDIRSNQRDAHARERRLVEGEFGEAARRGVML